MRRLLDAGAAVFAERGYHAARVDDIVKAARTSHGTFYLYFANKEDLLRALAVEVATEMTRLAAEFPALTAGPEGQGALRAWLARFADLYARTGPVIRVWTEAEISDSEFGRIGAVLVQEFIARLVARLRSAAPDLHAPVAALAIVSMIERTSYFLVVGTLRAPRDAVLDTLTGAIHNAVHGASVAPTRA